MALEMVGGACVAGVGGWVLKALSLSLPPSLPLSFCPPTPLPPSSLLLSLPLHSSTDNVHFQHTAKLVQVLTDKEVQFRVQVSITRFSHDPPVMSSICHMTHSSTQTRLTLSRGSPPGTISMTSSETSWLTLLA